MTKHIILSIFATVFLSSSPFAAAADGKSAAEKVYATVNDSIFMVFDVHNDNPKKIIDYGSAVAVTTTMLVTNCHVAQKGDARLVKIHDQLIAASTVYQDSLNDICLLKITGQHLQPVKFRSASSVNIGEEVFTIGSPRGYEKTISRGIISNKIKFKETFILQTDAAISPGSSGGGLFDTKSNLIGVTFSKNEAFGSEGIGFAIPAEMIQAAVEKYIST